MSIKKSMLVFMVTTLISLSFIVYVANLYFDIYTLTYRFHVSVQNVHLVHHDSSFFLESVLLLENPSKLDLKISYVQQEIYLDPYYRVRVDDRIHNFLVGTNEYVALVRQFSNSTLTVKVRLVKDISSNPRLWFLFFIRIDGIPLKGFESLEYFSVWFFNLQQYKHG